jgi:hypothetical protein
LKCMWRERIRGARAGLWRVHFPVAPPADLAKASAFSGSET